MYISDFFDTTKEPDKSYIFNHVVYFGLKTVSEMYNVKTNVIFYVISGFVPK